MKNRSLILELHEKFKDKKFREEFYKKLVEQRKFNKENFNSIVTEVEIKNKPYSEKDLLSNIPYSIKDIVCTKGIRTTGSSKILQNYVPLYDSTVYKLLKNTGATLIAKDTSDEFALGGTGTYCGFGMVYNYWDKKLIPGGSSSGSTTNVASGLSVFAITSDTGDSTRHPASFQNNVGYKGSYGLVSRFGVYPFAPSFDAVGIEAKYVTDVAIVLSQIAKYDPNDATCIKQKNYDFYKKLKPADLKKTRFVYFKDAERFMNTKAKVHWQKYINWLKTKVDITEVDLGDEITESLLPTYIVLSFAEATTSCAGLTGVTCGELLSGKNYKEMVMNSRTKYLGLQVKRRLLLGSFALNNENYEEMYEKAKKVRAVIKAKVDKLLNDYDCLILSGCGTFALTVEELVNPGMNHTDDLLMLANFAGTPSINVPAIKLKPYFMGINLNCAQFQDQKLLNIALAIENLNEAYVEE